ncbi:MAG: hypothetical protein FWF90_03540 [Promicromonosporaceae bacterium]|nr:hypothetical protein [Promicromonosporaceae bacterium]
MQRALVAVQRDKESRDLLAAMATPTVLPGPEPQLQTGLARVLNAAIDAERDKRQQGGTSAVALSVTEFGNAMFIGAIELTDVSQDIDTLVATSVLKDLPAQKATGDSSGHSLATTENGFVLVQVAGVQANVVALVLRTMDAARQIEYLRKRGFVGRGWKILVEVHYYRKRPKASHKFHKDTLGQTLFVNLNYETGAPIAGPEYVVNPEADPAHDAKVDLPTRFKDDLAATRATLGAPTTIEAPVIPAGGAVAFVDEAIHHMTPQVGHRHVPASELRAFLVRTRPRTTAKAERALAAFNAHGGSLFAQMQGELGPGEDAATVRRWVRRMQIVDAGGDVTRPVLTDLGLTTKEIDRLLAEASGDATEGYQQAAVPGVEKVPVTRNGVRLTRAMSTKALQGALPPDTTGDRTFFRTWVRAVRV